VSAPIRSDLRAGLRVSLVSVIWSVTVCSAAVVAGAVDGSLVLIAFGVTGLLDGAGSLTLVLHFRDAMASSLVSSRRERFALRVVSAGLIAIGASTIAESTRRLIVDQAGHGSPVGIGLAGASAAVLTVLAAAKWRIARRLPSDALRADGWLSATGAALAVIAVTGAALSSGANTKWIDPVAALCVACVAAAVGVIELRREERAM
jgi:divalent metal cation (Fe/Co/Zn/Cd) transporter